MTQTYESPFTEEDDLAVVATQKIPNTFATLRDHFAGTSPPPNPVAHQFWVDQSNSLLMQRNAANTAWDIFARLGVPTSQQTLGPGVHGTVNATVNLFVGLSPAARTVTKIILVSNAASTSTSGNEVTFQLRNLTAAQNLFSGTVGTFTALGGVGGGADLVANTAYVLTPNQNANIAANAALELQITYVGAPTATLTRFTTYLVVE